MTESQMQQAAEAAASDVCDGDVDVDRVWRLVKNVIAKHFAPLCDTAHDHIGDATELITTVAAKDAETQRLRAEIARLDQLVCDFQAASGLEDSSGDPGSITPDHLATEVMLLNEQNRHLADAGNTALAERDAAVARLAAAEKVVEAVVKRDAAHQAVVDFYDDNIPGQANYDDELSEVCNKHEAAKREYLEALAALDAAKEDK